MGAGPEKIRDRHLSTESKANIFPATISFDAEVCTLMQKMCMCRHTRMCWAAHA